MASCKPPDIQELNRSLASLESFAVEHFKGEKAAWFDAHMKASEGADEKAAEIHRLVSSTLNTKGLDDLIRRWGEETHAKIQTIRSGYVGMAPHAPKVVSHEDRAIVQATLPSGDRGLQTLHPYRAAVFSTHPEKGIKLLAEGTATDIPNAALYDYWCWASGAGNGWFGSGAGSYNVFAYWWYPFVPPENRSYGITSHGLYRGFYIVRADDGFWTSKYARAVVNQWTNAYQYNWKGWQSMNVMDVGNDNIDVNNRLDTDRHQYYSTVLGEGDLAWILVSIGLYVYARGDGSYAETNFAAGAANYLMAPHVHVS